MAYNPAPARTELSDTFPNPSNAVFKGGIGKLFDMVTGLFGTSGNPEDALAASKHIRPDAIYNLAPSYSVGSNALTITLADKDSSALSANNPAYVAQRSATLSSGSWTLRKLSANISMVISSGSTLGHISARLCPIYIYVIDNAGTQEMAVAGTFQGESGIFTTTAEGGGGGADSADVMYSTTARSNVSGRLIAIAWSNQTTAGTWAATPSETRPRPFHLERVGVSEIYMGGTVPYGFLLEDGSNVSRTTYAKLFSKIGTTWGVGDGSTTFGLPDSRRRVPVGSGGSGTGTLGNAVGNTGGAETHTLSSGEMPSHTHTQFANADGAGGGAGGAQRIATDTLSPATGSAGSGSAHNNMQPSMVVTKMVRWLGDI